MDKHYLNKIRQSIAGELYDHNPAACDVLIDALSGHRPLHEILSALESVGLLCKDSVKGAFMNAPDRVEIHFLWSLDENRQYTAHVEIRADLGRGEAAVKLEHGEKIGGVSADEIWRILHARTAAAGAEEQYQCVKELVSLVCTNTYTTGKVMEGGDGQSS